MLSAALLAVMCAGGAAQPMPVASPGAAAPPASTRLSPEPSWLGPDMNPSEGRIGIDVAVTDAQGNAATGLQQSDFKLLDEGQPMPLVSFAASSANGPASGDPPVSIILVLDEADIPSAHFGEAQQALELFLRSNGGRLAHAVTVYRVTTKNVFAAGPSQDGNGWPTSLPGVRTCTRCGLDQWPKSCAGLQVSIRIARHRRAMPLQWPFVKCPYPSPSRRWAPLPLSSGVSRAASSCSGLVLAGAST